MLAPDASQPCYVSRLSIPQATAGQAAPLLRGGGVLGGFPSACGQSTSPFEAGLSFLNPPSGSGGEGDGVRRKPLCGFPESGSLGRLKPPSPLGLLESSGRRGNGGWGVPPSLPPSHQVALAGFPSSWFSTSTCMAQAATALMSTARRQKLCGLSGAAQETWAATGSERKWISLRQRSSR